MRVLYLCHKIVIEGILVAELSASELYGCGLHAAEGQLIYTMKNKKLKIQKTSVRFEWYCVRKDMP